MIIKLFVIEFELLLTRHGQLKTLEEVCEKHDNKQLLHDNVVP